MTIVDINALQTKAANYGSKHVERFAPIIPILLNALQAAGHRVEQRYTYQCLINGRYVGRYRHPDVTTGKQSRIEIYDGSPGVIIAEIYTKAEADAFAAGLKIR